jgi:hypothetical protein
LSAPRWLVLARPVTPKRHAMSTPCSLPH